MTIPMYRKLALATLVSLTVLAGCGNDDITNASGRYFLDLGKGIAGSVKQIGQKPVARKQPDPELVASSAMKLNKGPLLLLSMENTGYIAPLGMTGETGGMRTWFTPHKLSVITRNGMLAGTRGFAYDLMSADTQATERLIRARRAGSASLILRHLDGLGRERPMILTCQTRIGKEISYPFIGKTWHGTAVAERCEANGMAIDNSFVVASDGTILLSRQWGGPQLGYITLQMIRP